MFDRASGWLVVLLLLVLVLVDRVSQARARRRRPDLLLPGETWNGLNPSRMLVAGFVAPPWSTLAVWHVVLQRRAALFALAAGGPPQGAETVVGSVARLGRATDRARWSAAARATLRPIRWRAWWSWRG